MMEWIKVVLLGSVEGLTEFIPVSSTGHLIILEKFLNLNTENVETFQIAIQLGAILAVLVAYRIKLKSILKSKDTTVRLASRLALASLPVFIVGFLSYDFIKTHLFSPIYVACALIVGSLAMIFVELKPSKAIKTNQIEDITIKQSLVIGLFQIASLWTGMSRSGSTIVGGLFSSCNHKVAADFSFLLALPVISAAVGYDLFKSVHHLSIDDISMICIGAIISFIVAIFAIKTFLIWLEKVRLIPFAIYRLVLAVFVLLLSI